jgi:hemerythrin-like domain-containing protein
MAELHRTRGEAIEGKPRPVAPLGRPSVGEELPDLSPAELLSLEHDLIRRVVIVLERQSARIGEAGKVDPVFLATIVDFIVTYAGRVHHGKEEEILFRQLHENPLSPEHRQMMEVLARDHVEMRRLAGELAEANDRYHHGEEEALHRIREASQSLIELYPGHIETEDEDFFPEAMDYLDDDERQRVLEAMRGHDRAMIHEKYGSVADTLDARIQGWELEE